MAYPVRCDVMCVRREEKHKKGEERKKEIVLRSGMMYVKTGERERERKVTRKQERGGGCLVVSIHNTQDEEKE